MESACHKRALGICLDEIVISHIVLASTPSVIMARKSGSNFVSNSFGWPTKES